mmetsp:Transcript_19085/g.21596  ORF Transcript_19085/g.21596 Transcript_19085/m.21596 type:complete len:91 (-) Transcript_19085:1254-1526(-)
MSFYVCAFSSRFFLRISYVYFHHDTQHQKNQTEEKKEKIITQKSKQCNSKFVYQSAVVQKYQQHAYFLFKAAWSFVFRETSVARVEETPI